LADEAKHGNYKPLWTAGIYVPGMMGADMMRGFIQNYGSLPSYQKDWDALDYIYNGIDRSGLTGVGSLLTDYKADVNHGGTGFESVSGPMLEQTKQSVMALSGGPEAKMNFLKRALPGAPLFANINMAQPRE
jgi:hypothetical protein